MAIALLTAALVSAAAGLLTWRGGMNGANAVLTAGAAFGATVILVVQLVQFMHGRSR